MAKTSTPISSEARGRLLRRLSVLFAISVTGQAIAFLAVVWVFHIGARSLLRAIAGASGPAPSPTAAAFALAAFALDFFLALVVAFFGARWLHRAIRRAMPPQFKMPSETIPVAGLCAGAIAAAVSVLEYGASGVPLRDAGVGWTFALLRNAAVVALFWFAAGRAVRARPAR